MRCDARRPWRRAADRGSGPVHAGGAAPRRAGVRRGGGPRGRPRRRANGRSAINPLLPGARYLLGLVEQRRGDAAAAERELRKTVYIDRGFALAHLNLGTLYRGQERWDAACEAYEAAVRAAREDPDGRWTAFLGGFDADTLVRTAERGLVECRKASGAA